LSGLLVRPFWAGHHFEKLRRCRGSSLNKKGTAEAVPFLFSALLAREAI
jgi:hypothetical protein